MLYVFFGNDRAKANEALKKSLAKASKKEYVIRITDANSAEDLREVLRGGGMFGEKRAVVLDGVFANDEMRSIVLAALAHLNSATENFFILEGKLDADTRKKVEKHAEKVERFDTKKEREGGEIFALARALERGDKKALWVEYQRALAREEAPEAIHGVLFWGAKNMFLKSRGEALSRAEKLVGDLAELPHAARRRGFELEYALERYLLSIGSSSSLTVNKS